MSAIPVLLVLLGSVMKLLKLPAVHEGFAKAGLSGTADCAGGVD